MSNSIGSASALYQSLATVNTELKKHLGLIPINSDPHASPDEVKQEQKIFESQMSQQTAKVASQADGGADFSTTLKNAMKNANANGDGQSGFRTPEKMAGVVEIGGDTKAVAADSSAAAAV